MALLFYAGHGVEVAGETDLVSVDVSGFEGGDLRVDEEAIPLGQTLLALKRATTQDHRARCVPQQSLQGVNQACANLQSVLEAGNDVDDILDDYQALQADLETVEAQRDE